MFHFKGEFAISGAVNVEPSDRGFYPAYAWFCPYCVKIWMRFSPVNGAEIHHQVFTQKCAAHPWPARGDYLLAGTLDVEWDAEYTRATEELLLPYHNYLWATHDDSIS